MPNGIPEQKQKERLEMGIPIRHEPPLLIRYTKEFGVVLDVISKLIIHHPHQKTDARWEEGDGAVVGGVAGCTRLEQDSNHTKVEIGGELLQGPQGSGKAG